MDPEIQAMCRADRLLAELPDDASERVIGWLTSKYGHKPRPTPSLLCEKEDR